MSGSALMALGAATVAAGVGAVFSGAAGAVRVEQVAAAVIVVIVGALAARRTPAPQPRSGPDYEAGRRQWSSLYQLESAVLIGTQSRHHYDLGLRPRLQRVLHALAASRCGVDLSASPGAGRDLVGEQLWPLVDPARPASRDSRPDGVDLAALERLLGRLERLSR